MAKRATDQQVGWCDRRQAAELMGVGVDHIDRAIHSGRLRAKRVGRLIRIKLSDLDAWFDELEDA